MDTELGEADVQSSAEEDSSEEEESSSEEEEKAKVAESSGSSSAASSSSGSEAEDEQQDVGSPKDPSPVEAGSPGQTSPTGQGEDSEQAEQVRGDVGSPLATEEEEEESQFPSTQQLFGADSSGSESSSGDSPEGPPMSPEQGKESPTESPKQTKESPARNGEGEGETRTVEGLFGDTAELSSSEDERMSTGEGAGLSGEGAGLDDLSGERGGQEDVEEEVPRINVEIPRCVANLGSDIHFVKLPNFLSVETRPFDPELYEDEGEEDEILDEEGRARLKLKVENTIRWRYSTDESGNEIRESNARLVKWSDGTMSLYLGSEIFDIYRQPLQGEFSHLFVRQGTGLQGQAVFRSKLTFRPHSTDSQTHRKMTLSIADRFSKAQKIRVLPAVGKDPESQRLERIKREEDNLKAAIRREHHKRRLREKNLQKGGLSASYLEPDRDLESEEDLGAIKSSVRSRLSRRQGGDSDSSGSESDGGGESRLIKAKEEQGSKSAGSGVARRRRKLLSDDEDEDSSD